MNRLDFKKTALILIGFQNDYFDPSGILHGVIEESSQATGALDKTLELLDQYGADFGAVIATPIIFTQDYSELKEPVGILKTIVEVGAFKEGTHGSQSIPQLQPFAGFLKEVPGKRGLNAFSNTELEATLREKNIDTVILAGAVTSICIDSTGRAASEMGFKVMVLADCTTGRTNIEQQFYCDQVFPLYAEVLTQQTLLERCAEA